MIISRWLESETLKLSFNSKVAVKPLGPYNAVAVHALHLPMWCAVPAALHLHVDPTVGLTRRFPID